MENFKSTAGSRVMLVGANCKRGAVYNSDDETLRELYGLRCV